MFNTPVLFLVFNRPDLTKRVFEQIRKIQPSSLFIAADGPRPDKPSEDKICAEVKDIILSNIDWDCDVKTLFREQNLGCGKAVSQAITWFFENVEEGIILEDDCLPNLSFFCFCELMLKRFKHDHQIMHISGNNFQLSKIGMQDYYLTKIPHIWGWATWKRAWNKYDFNLLAFDTNKKQRYFLTDSIDKFWNDTFDFTKINLHTWDYQWVYTIFNNNALCIAPQNNLVLNIGFNKDGTHITNEYHYLSNLKQYEMNNINSNVEKCTYEMVHDINEHIQFNWIKKDCIQKPLTMRTFIKQIQSKIIHKSKVLKLKAIKFLK